MVVTTKQAIVDQVTSPNASSLSKYIENWTLSPKLIVMFIA